LYAWQAIDFIIRVRADEGLREAHRAATQAEKRFRAFVMASWDIVYRMSPDWKEMCYLKGKGFVSDTEDPSALWIEKYIDPA
jgi:hypothetical protein